MKNDYEIIKDKYSERMAKICRTLFPTFLEEQGKLSKLLLAKFYPNPTLYQDLVMGKADSFKNYIYSFFDIKNDNVKTDKSVKELLDMAGYNLYECSCEEDIQSFKKYYQKNEEICTFDGGRLNTHYVFFAVSKDVDKIKREDFSKPIREDKYGTSVISIQFSRGTNNTLSIKNRYNHIVDNPDATFSNNLDNIIPGLTNAFSREYHLNIDKVVDPKLDLFNYEMANDGRFYKYNYKIGNICYCPNNIIINNGQVLKADSSRYKIADYFIIDYKEKKISLYDEKLHDSFCKDKLKRIDVEHIPNSKNINITLLDNFDNKTCLELDESSRIVGISSKDMEEVPDNYLSSNKYLQKLDLENTKKIGNNVLENNESLYKYNLNNVVEIGTNFLCNNDIITNLNLPSVRYIGDGLLYFNDSVDEVFMPKLQSVGDECFYYNDKMCNLRLPNIENIGKEFFFLNSSINVSLPRLKMIGDGAFGYNMDTYSQLMEVIDKNGREFNQRTNEGSKEITSNKTR